MISLGKNGPLATAVQEKARTSTKCPCTAAAAAILADISFDYLQRWGHTREALDLHQRLDGHLTHPRDRAVNHNNLGLCYAALGQVAAAIDHHQQALTIYRGIGYPYGEALALVGLGEAADQTTPSGAADWYGQALEIGERTGNAQAVSYTHLTLPTSDLV